MERIVALHLIGNEARNQVTIKRKKQFLHIQHQSCPRVDERELSQSCVVLGGENVRKLLCGGVNHCEQLLKGSGGIV